LFRRIASEALSHFPIEVTRLRLLHDGYNVTCEVRGRDQGGAVRRFALRVSRPELTAHRVASEVAWCEALARDTDVRVLRIVRTRADAPMVEVEGRCCVLSTWVAGAQRHKSLSPAMIEAVGAVSARMHQHGQQWQPPTDFDRPVFDTVWLGSPSPLPALADDIALSFAEAEQRLLPLLRRLVAERCHIVHADLHQWNYRIAKGHDVGVIDFDDCALASPTQDVAISFYYLRRHPGHRALWDAFRRGYERVAPWPLDDPTRDALLVWRAMGLCASVMTHENPRLRALGAKLLPTYTQQVRDWLACG